MNRLGVFVHFDSAGEVAPHVRHTLSETATVVDKLVIVSTAPLTETAREILCSYGELIERENIGYDFMSYKTGIDSVDLDDFDEVFISNDSCVGPVIPMVDIFADMENRPFDVWGMTINDSETRHIQSYFVVFKNTAVRHPAFKTFWESVTVLIDRMAVIKNYEFGLSQAMFDAGLRLGAYYQPTTFEIFQAHLRLSAARLRIEKYRQLPRLLRRPLEPLSYEVNPTAGMADQVLGSARLPIVKLSTLRQDPYNLGNDQLLWFCEHWFPVEFEGVRDYLMRYRDFRKLIDEPFKRRVLPPLRYGGRNMSDITRRVQL